MAEVRTGHDWDQTASILALLAETNRDPKKRYRPFTPADFHPLHRRKRKRRDLSEADMQAQLEFFAGKKFGPKEPTLFETIFGRK